MCVPDTQDCGQHNGRKPSFSVFHHPFPFLVTVLSHVDPKLLLIWSLWWNFIAAKGQGSGTGGRLQFCHATNTAKSNLLGPRAPLGVALATFFKWCL